MLKRFLKNERGLTLVELLAVIVILGIIAAIAVPNIGGLISRTEEDAVKADAVQVLNAAKLYATTHNGEISSAGNTGVTLFKDNDNATTDKDDLTEYLDNPPELYSITIKKTNGKMVFSAVTVGKNGTKMTFSEESEVLDGTPDTTTTY